jgi:integral membrane protein
MSVTNHTNSLRWLRYAGIAEGISFLVLLLIAMPLKYIFKWPQAVQVVGWAHGVLFVGFGAMALYYQQQYNKSFGWLVRAGIAALLPLGTFIWERRIQREATTTPPPQSQSQS